MARSMWRPLKTQKIYMRGKNILSSQIFILQDPSIVLVSYHQIVRVQFYPFWDEIRNLEVIINTSLDYQIN